MTVAVLIADVLGRIRQSFYRDRTREFTRDHRSLMKAVARYGYECEKRGWEFEITAIRAELVGLLHSIISKRAEIQYLPVYLEGAVDRHIRTRAEELSAAATKIGSVTKLALQTVRVADVREPTPVETLAMLYRDLRRLQRQSVKPARQGALL